MFLRATATSAVRIATGLVLLLTLFARATLADVHLEVDEGRRHYDRGLEKYALADFDGAVVEFKQAYELSHTPMLLFNLAQAQRRMKRYDEALHFYRAYLRAMPDAPNRGDAEKLTSEMEGALQKAASPERAPTVAAPLAVTRTTAMRSAAPSDPTPHPLSPPSPASRARADARPSSTELFVIGGATVGVGVAVLASGIYFGSRARSVESGLSGLAASGGTWSDAWQHAYDDGQRDAKIATALYAVGAVAIGTGAIVAIIGATRRAHRGPWARTQSGTVSCAF